MDKLKIKRKAGYTVLPNAVLRDKNLTLQAKGLFAVMFSLPDEWDFSVKGLATLANCGRDKVRAALDSLETAGYLLREQTHDETGRFSGNDFILYDECQSPLPGFPATGKPSTEKPLPENPTLLSKEQVIKEKRTPIAPKEVLDAARKYVGEDRELADALYGLLENRFAMKKPVKTLRSLNGILRELDKLSEGDRATKVAMLRKATTSNWLTVYALKSDEVPQRSASGGREEFGWKN